MIQHRTNLTMVLRAQKIKFVANLEQYKYFGCWRKKFIVPTRDTAMSSYNRQVCEHK